MEEGQNGSDQTSQIVTSGDVDQTGSLNPQETATAPSGNDGSVSWVVDEFVAHRKGLSWYVLLFAGAVILAAIAWLLTKDKITALVFIVAAVILAIFGSKKPREQQYRIDHDGLHIADRRYPFDRFRSFAMVRQDDYTSLQFMPMRRFAMIVTAYYDPADENKIVDILSSYLPLEEKRRDLLDELMWRIRF